MGHTRRSLEWATQGDPKPAATPANAMNVENNAAPSPSTVTLSHEDFEHLLKMAHGERVLPSASIANAGTSHFISSSTSQCLIDSGASDHMTSQSQLFSTFSTFRTPTYISLADGRKAAAIGKGRICLTPDLTLEEVLLVPHSLLASYLCTSYVLLLLAKFYSHPPAVFFRIQGEGGRLGVA